MDRRAFLTAAIGAAAATPALAALESGTPPVLRGTLNAAELGLNPEARADQSRGLQQLLEIASSEDRDLFLPPGTYFVSDLKLPARARLTGVAGATRIVFGGAGDTMITAERAEIIALANLTFDGAGALLSEYVPGILHLVNCHNVSIENCVITGSTASGLALDRCEGRITRNMVREVREAGIRVVESVALSITDNTVEDCGDGGILVHRWSEGEDGTIVTGNRISRIAAKSGGTGQYGNGINVFRAHGVIVANNRIADCAFTAIRANSSNNVQIMGNNCTNSGEVGIFSEFAFEGAMIANNIVDGAASGISVANFNEGGRIAVVSNNIVRNLRTVGPYAVDPPGFGTGISIEADATVTGNVIEAAPLYGMALGWGPFLRDVAATGNVIRGAPVGIAVTVVEGAGSAVISDNLISGADKGAILGMRWSETATGDLVLTGGRGYPHLLIERNRVS